MAAIAGRPSGTAALPVPLLLRFYPAAWRERYGDEFAELLLARPPSLRDRFDILRGAVDARLRPQVGVASPADTITPRDRSAAALIVVAGLLLTTWAALGVAYGGRWDDAMDTASRSAFEAANAAGLLGSFLMACALLLIASRYDRWIGSAGAVGAVLTGAGLVFASFGGGLAPLFLLGAGTMLFAARIQGQLVGRLSALVITVATMTTIAAFLAVAASGWRDMTPFTLLLLYGPAWIIVGLDLRVPVREARFVGA